MFTVALLPTDNIFQWKWDVKDMCIFFERQAESVKLIHLECQVVFLDKEQPGSVTIETVKKSRGDIKRTITTTTKNIYPFHHFNGPSFGLTTANVNWSPGDECYVFDEDDGEYYRAWVQSDNQHKTNLRVVYECDKTNNTVSVRKNRVIPPHFKNPLHENYRRFLHGQHGQATMDSIPVQEKMFPYCKAFSYIAQAVPHYTPVSQEEATRRQQQPQLKKQTKRDKIDGSISINITLNEMLIPIQIPYEDIKKKIIFLREIKKELSRDVLCKMSSGRKKKLFTKKDFQKLKLIDLCDINLNCKDDNTFLKLANDSFVKKLKPMTTLIKSSCTDVAKLVKMLEIILEAIITKRDDDDDQCKKLCKDAQSYFQHLRLLYSEKGYKVEDIETLVKSNAISQQLANEIKPMLGISLPDLSLLNMHEEDSSEEESSDEELAEPVSGGQMEVLKEIVSSHFKLKEEKTMIDMTPYALNLKYGKS